MKHRWALLLFHVNGSFPDLVVVVVVVVVVVIIIIINLLGHKVVTSEAQAEGG